MHLDLSHSLLVGQGATSIHTARYLKEHGYSFNIYSQKSNRLPDDLMEYYVTEPIYASLVWVSPGISPDDAIIKTLDPSVPKILDIDYFLLHTKSKCLLVTGTNGKSTVVKYAQTLLAKDNRSVGMYGNYQPGILQALTTSPEWVIIELSSYMLYWMAYQHTCLGGILLPVTKDHISWHGSYKHYLAAKLKIQTMVRHMVDMRTSSKVACELNQLAVHTLFDQLGINYQPDVLPSLPFRMTVQHMGDNIYINDSKATNLAATISAISYVKKYYPNKPILLILAGIAKQKDHGELLPYLSGTTLCVVGEDYSDLNPYIHQRFDCIEAIKPCMMEHRGVILFSPAGSSYDRYTGFEARGDAFNKLIRIIHKG